MVFISLFGLHWGNIDLVVFFQQVYAQAAQDLSMNHTSNTIFSLYEGKTGIKKIA